jgi:cytochrome oxidase Cu insertion factor (SCO1/SenC/PrrC family)
MALVALTMAVLLAVACGSSESSPAAAAPTPETSAKVRVGSDIGNRLPDFELTLTSNGKKLTSTSLVESGRPAFLFFFATT